MATSLSMHLKSLRLKLVQFLLGHQFSIFRVVFGLYLIFQFIEIWIYSADIYGQQGFFEYSNQDMTEFARNSMFGFTVLTSLFYTLGLQRRWAAAVLALLWAFLNFRIPFVTVPSHGYIGWFLLVSILIPGGEPWSLSKRDLNWRMPPLILESAWFVIGLSYTASGLDKLLAPSWLNGEAMLLVLKSPVAFSSWGQELILSAPTWLTQILTWSALILEVVYAPLCLFKGTRKLAWIMIVALHLQALYLLDIRSVSIMMLIAHGFVFDPEWLEFKKPREAKSEVWREQSLAIAIFTLFVLNLAWLSFKNKPHELKASVSSPVVHLFSDDPSRFSQIESPHAFCSKIAASGKMYFEGRVLLNAAFLINPKKPNADELNAAVAAQLEFAGRETRSLIYSNGIEVLSSPRASRKIEIQEVRKIQYGLELVVDASRDAKDSQNKYLQKALARGFTHSRDSAWEASYQMVQEVATCLSVAPSAAQLEWRLPRDPFLAFWLIEKEHFREKGLFPCAARIPIAANFNALTSVWNPLQVGEDKNKLYYDCAKILKPNVHVFAGMTQLELHEQSKYVEPLANVGSFLKSELSLHADLILGWSQPSAQLAAMEIPLEKALERALHSTKSVSEITEKLVDPSMRLLVSSIRDLATYFGVTSFKVEKSALNWMFLLNGKLSGSNKPLVVRIFWGTTNLAGPDKASHWNFFADAIANSQVVVHLGQSRFEENFDLQKFADPLPGRQSNLPYQVFAIGGIKSHAVALPTMFEGAALRPPKIRDFITNASYSLNTSAYFIGLLREIDHDIDRVSGKISFFNITNSLGSGNLMIAQRRRLSPEGH